MWLVFTERGHTHEGKPSVADLIHCSHFMHVSTFRPADSFVSFVISYSEHFPPSTKGNQIGKCY